MSITLKQNQQKIIYFLVTTNEFEEVYDVICYDFKYHGYDIFRHQIRSPEPRTEKQISLFLLFF